MNYKKILMFFNSLVLVVAVAFASFLVFNAVVGFTKEQKLKEITSKTVPKQATGQMHPEKGQPDMAIFIHACGKVVKIDAKSLKTMSEDDIRDLIALANFSNTFQLMDQAIYCEIARALLPGYFVLGENADANP